MIETVLLTGATGFVGRELLWRLARTPGCQVVCLLRSRSGEDPGARLKTILEKARPRPLTPDQKERVTAIQGDLTRDRLGLPASQWEKLAGTIHRVVHGAASVDWTLPLEAARNVNTEGARRMVELAKAAHAGGVLRRFDYISTVHVCGRRRGRILEEDLDSRHGFFNTYEQSKFEAEQLVRTSGLPFATFRLSMVVGDSKTGYASTFKVMYWPLKVLSRGMAWIVPADRAGIVDLVPVDYVCDALETISLDPAQRGRTFHLAAGPGNSSTIGELLDLALRSFGVRAPLLVPPGLFLYALRPLLYMVTWGKQRDLMKKSRVYLPYFCFGAAFDTTQTRSALDGEKFCPPPVQDYFQKLVDYALASDWGKRDPERV